jgi:hypothetical protein
VALSLLRKFARLPRCDRRVLIETPAGYDWLGLSSPCCSSAVSGVRRRVRFVGRSYLRKPARWRCVASAGRSSPMHAGCHGVPCVSARPCREVDAAAAWDSFSTLL